MRGSGGASPPSAGGSRRAPGAGRAAPRLCAVAGRAWAVAAVGAGARAPPSPLSEPPEAARRPRLAPRSGALGADGAEAGERQCRGRGVECFWGGEQRREAAGPCTEPGGSGAAAGRGAEREGRGGAAGRAGLAALCLRSCSALQPGCGVVAVLRRPLPAAAGLGTW